MITQARGPGRYRSAIAVAASFGLVLLLGGTGWVMLRPEPTSQTATWADPLAPVGSSTPTPGVTTPTPTPTPTPTSTPTRPKPRPTPTKKPPKSQLPPPPPPPKPGCTPKAPGPNASHDAVAAALAAAGSQDYWQGVVPPDGVDDLPAMSVPRDLMYAFAWTESSWISSVVACDGGIGLMQLMPDNVTFINTRFGTDFDVHTVAGNTQLGAAYIEWLTAYFGTYYFGSYDLMHATAKIGTGGTTLSLLNVVIAAYNVGPAAVEDTHGTADGSDDTLSIPNQTYVTKVRTYLSDCPCTTAPTTSPTATP